VGAGVELPAADGVEIGLGPAVLLGAGAGVDPAVPVGVGAGVGYVVAVGVGAGLGEVERAGVGFGDAEAVGMSPGSEGCVGLSGLAVALAGALAWVAPAPVPETS
jgi:hypothetical protein